MALLQQMRYCVTRGEEVVHVCIVEEITKGGEFTTCGHAIPDSSLRYSDFGPIGKEFKGSIKRCTCPNCLKVVNYYKKLR